MTYEERQELETQAALAKAQAAAHEAVAKVELAKVEARKAATLELTERHRLGLEIPPVTPPAPIVPWREFVCRSLMRLAPMVGRAAAIHLIWATAAVLITFILTVYGWRGGPQ